MQLLVLFLKTPLTFYIFKDHVLCAILQVRKKKKQRVCNIYLLLQPKSTGR